MKVNELNRVLGNVDLFLLDQILKGTFDQQMKILDAGCGEGRNLNYFFSHNYSIYGIDRNPAAIRMLHFVLRSAYPDIDIDQFSVGVVESMPYKNEDFDAILCQAVLHFAQDHDHFMAMFSELHRCLKPNGLMLISCGYRALGMRGNRNSEFSFQLDDATIKQLERFFKLQKSTPAKWTAWENGPSLIELVFKKL
ncbi:MAG: class I SAM-dependent methyltransferase [Cyclobacteriaceae bacterium]